MRVDKTSDNSFAVALGYTQRVSRYVGLSADYLSEGHPPLHHRDGLGAQLWLHSAVPERGWSVGAGFGPYYYFDTTTCTSVPTSRRACRTCTGSPTMTARCC